MFFVLLSLSDAKEDARCGIVIGIAEESQWVSSELRDYTDSRTELTRVKLVPNMKKAKRL